MCHETTGAAFDRPMFDEDIELIAAHFPELSLDGIHAVAIAITDHHWPQPAVLIAVLEMIDRAQQHDIGYYTQPTMPFSAMDLETYERVQSDGMYAFHAVFESMALAQRNMQLLNQVLKSHFGLQLVLFCDCGCGIIAADENAFDSSWYKQINELRSLAEAAGTPVIRVSDFQAQEWQRRELDMGRSEEASYEKMFAILKSLPSREFDIHDLASRNFKQMFPAETAA